MVQILAGAREFSLFHSGSISALCPIQPPIQLVLGTLHPVSKQPRGEADHTSPSSAEVKNEWSFTSTAQYASNTWTGTLVRLAQE